MLLLSIKVRGMEDGINSMALIFWEMMSLEASCR